jgi:translation initiation factor 2B subunit (eIF-2B alpha/beta/delta family)
VAAHEEVESAQQAFEAAVRRVRDDREHGASWLAREVSRAVLDATPERPSSDATALVDALHGALRAFARARPSMAAVANVAATIWTSGGAGDPAERLAAMRAEAQRIATSEERAQAAIIAALRPLAAGVVYTHSRSGTVENALVALAHDGQEARAIYVSTSYPGGEGTPAARALAGAGWHVTLVADAACGVFVSSASVVIVGADSVRADGSVVNKVGTYPLALAAHQVRVPLYAVCETFKIAASDFPFALEEMDPRELLPEPIRGVEARNVYFDRTPPERVAGIVTERGVLHAEDITQLAQAAGRALTNLDAE